MQSISYQILRTTPCIGSPYLAAAPKSLQSCPTLCDPRDGSPPGSPVPGILKAVTLEWVAISFSNARKWKVKGKWLSRVQLLATPWTAAQQAPPSMGFARQECWSGCHRLLRCIGSTLAILLMRELRQNGHWTPCPRKQPESKSRNSKVRALPLAG